MACHPSEHDSFSNTAHSQAFAKAGELSEPDDGSFTHERSKLEYSTAHDGANFHHRIVLKDDEPKRLANLDLPIDFTIGSGNHSRSYLVKSDGFLFESPITWYADRKAWGLSPGFDQPVPTAFDRIVDTGCLYCHVGRLETPLTGRFRPQIVENAIGCESCHGPGSLHVENRRKIPVHGDSEAADLSIVNPTRLSRDLAEQVCSFCHLRGDATIGVRDRSLTDYRPGLELADFRIEYFVETSDSGMSVTGHVEQMRLSKCYQASPQMTCITCHDPHRTASVDRLTDYRNKCLSCHSASCGLPSAARLQKQPQDNCMACHMPVGETDIPHIALTHHRIGIHGQSDSDPESRPRSVPELLAVGSLDHLSDADKLRCLGLAYVEVSEKQSTPGAAAACRDLARQKLRRAYQLGLQDAETLATLSGLEMEIGQRELAIKLSRAALLARDTASGAHENAHFILANAYLELNQHDSAERELLSLLKKRRRMDDWFVLSEIREQRGNLEGSIEALRKAEQFQPFHPDLQQRLAAALFRNGQREAAERHRQIGQLLQSRYKNATANPSH